MIGTSGGIEVKVATWGGVQVCPAWSLDGSHIELWNPGDPHGRLVTRCCLQIEPASKLIVGSAVAVEASGV